MTSVGMILRSAREAQGRAVSDVADTLCITQAYVQSLERDDLTSLPGTFFYKSFVKQYAELLEIPESEWRAAMSATLGRIEPPAPASEPAIAHRHEEPAWQNVFRVPDPILEAANRLDLSGRRVGASMGVLVLAVVACTSFYGWWMNRAAVAETLPPVISQTPVTETYKPVYQQTYQSEDDSMPSLDVTTTTDADGVRRVVLNLSAKEETWLSITSDGKQVFSGTLEPSETKTLTGLEVARMRVGNAGGLDIRWNGKPIGPIGESGQVRVVLFTPDDFQIIKPAPKPDPGETL